MALDLTHEELKIEVGRHVGFTRNSSNYTGDKDIDLASAIKRGLRMFYFANGYRWTFLQPWSTLTTKSEQRRYDLPEDFGAIGMGGFHRDEGSNQQRIAMVSQDDYQALVASKDLGGQPLYASIRASRVPPGSRTVYQVEFYPVPDDAYVIDYQYVLEPPMLVDDGDKPLGGVIHAQTVLYACLAAADEILNYESGERLHHKRYLESLQASIEIDRLAQPGYKVGGVE